jgi:hypothetical protein
MGNVKVRLLPTYLNSKVWENDFNKIRNNVFENYSAEHIVFGDCNERIGELQVLPPELTEDLKVGLTNTRCSKDKHVNRLGKQFVDFCDSMNLVLLNDQATLKAS